MAKLVANLFSYKLLTIPPTSCRKFKNHYGVDAISFAIESVYVRTFQDFKLNKLLYFQMEYPSIKKNEITMTKYQMIDQRHTVNREH